MSLEVYTLYQNERWDEIVRSFNDYDTYWLSGYVKAFEIHGDGAPLLFYYEDSNTRGINVVMKRDIADDSHFQNILPKDTYFDFSTPYGYGGWLVEGNETTNLFSKYESWCRKNGIISEFVRFHPVIENQFLCESAYDVIKLGKTVCLDLTSPDVVWANITSKNRNMIRKAKKNGITIYMGRYPEIFKEFREIYNRTMDKDNANEYYYFEPDFYDSVLNDLPENAQIFFAEYEGKIIAASIMLIANGKMNYHLSGSISEFSKLAPSNLLLYKAALWGCANGCKTLYLGGGVGSGEDSLFKFKKAFNRKDDDKSFYIGKKIFLVEKYEELLSKRENIDSAFFPKYRA